MTEIPRANPKKRKLKDAALIHSERNEDIRVYPALMIRLVSITIDQMHLPPLFQYKIHPFLLINNNSKLLQSTFTQLLIPPRIKPLPPPRPSPQPHNSFSQLPLPLLLLRLALHASRRRHAILQARSPETRQTLDFRCRRARRGLRFGDGGDLGFDVELVRGEERGQGC